MTPGLRAPGTQAAAGANAGIDQLRGLAVLLVWCHHVAAHAGLALPLVGHLGGLLGVQLFFVISGYLIVRSAQRETTGAYAVRRLLRIFPAYLVVVAVATTLSPRVSWELVRAEPAAFVVNLLALSHWWPPALQFFDVTTVNWTLAVELTWYALAPLLAAAVPAGGRRRGWLALGVLALVVSTGWVAAAQAGRLDAVFAPGIAAAGVSPVSEFMRFAYVVNAAPAHLVFFVTGALLLRFEASVRGLPAALLAGLVLATAPFADRWNDLLGLHPSFVSGIGLAALFVLVALRPGPSPDGTRQAPHGPHAAKHGTGRRIARALGWIGRVSYPVYLLHVPVLLAALALAGERWRLGPGAAVAAAVVATLALAWLVHLAIERPGIALGRRLTRRGSRSR